MSNIHVNRQVFDAVQHAVQTGKTNGRNSITGDEMRQIEQAVTADGDVSGEEVQLLESLRSGSQFKLTDGSSTTQMDPNSLAFPGRDQVRSVTQLREIARVQSVDRLQGATNRQTPQQLIENARGTFDLASRQLDSGKAEAAAQLLTQAASQLRAGAATAGNPEKDVLTELAHNMDARARAYRQDHPDQVMNAAGSMALYARNATVIADGLKTSHPAYAELLSQVGRDTRIQAEILHQTGANTKSMLGHAISGTYRSIVDTSFARNIANTGDINNFFTGNRDELERDRKRMTEVFNFIDTKMQQQGLTFHEAWHQMFDDHHIADKSKLPTFPTAHEAAVFLRDHQTSRGLLGPMAELSEGLYKGDGARVDRARGQMVEALRTNDQWEIAREVLNQYQAAAATPEGKVEAGQLNDNERSEWWKAKASQFAREDLPVLLLTGVVSGGAGLGARALAGVAGWGTRAARIAQISTELGSFVPTERILNDAINGRRADWSGGALARDYALTLGSYGLFRALGAGWRAVRSPSPVNPTLPASASRTAGGTPTPVAANEAKENIRALTRENESAQTLARNGYRVTQNPPIPGGGTSGVKMPDYRINGHLFDNYAPSTSSPRNIWTTVQDKVTKEQARRIVVNLDDSRVTMEALQKQFSDWPIEGLEQLLIVRNGQVVNLALPRPAASTPWFTPGAYPHQERDRQ